MATFVQTVVLMPGTDGTGELLREFAEALPDLHVETLRYPVDAWSSYEEMAERFIGEMPTVPFVLVAESYSTPLAVQVAARRPEMLRGVVLCAGFCTSPVKGWRRTLLLKAVVPLAQLPLPAWLARWMLLGDDASGALVEKVRSVVSWMEPMVLVGRIRAMLGCNVLEDLARVGVPLLYVQATQDRLVDRGCLEEMLRVRPGPTVGMDGPHLLLQKEPVLGAEVVMGFVRRLDGRGRRPEAEAHLS